MSKDIPQLLHDHSACDEAIKWSKRLIEKDQHRGWKWLWDNCPVPSWLLWLIYEMEAPRPIVWGTIPDRETIKEVIGLCRDYVVHRMESRRHLLPESVMRTAHKRLLLGDDHFKIGDNWVTLDCYVGALLVMNYPRAKWDAHYCMTSTIMEVGIPLANILRSKLYVTFAED